MLKSLISMLELPFIYLFFFVSTYFIDCFPTTHLTEWFESVEETER